MRLTGLACTPRVPDFNSLSSQVSRIRASRQSRGTSLWRGKAHVVGWREEETMCSRIIYTLERKRESYVCSWNRLLNVCFEGWELFAVQEYVIYSAIAVSGRAADLVLEPVGRVMTSSRG